VLTASATSAAPRTDAYRLGAQRTLLTASTGRRLLQVIRRAYPPPASGPLTRRNLEITRSCAHPKYRWQPWVDVTRGTYSGLDHPGSEPSTPRCVRRSTVKGASVRGLPRCRCRAFIFATLYESSDRSLSYDAIPGALRVSPQTTFAVGRALPAGVHLRSAMPRSRFYGLDPLGFGCSLLLAPQPLDASSSFARRRSSMSRNPLRRGGVYARARQTTLWPAVFLGRSTCSWPPASDSLPSGVTVPPALRVWHGLALRCKDGWVLPSPARGRVPQRWLRKVLAASNAAGYSRS